MNTSALKAFAPAVRKQLMEAVSIKLDFALSAITPDYMATYASQVRALRELALADRKGLVERVAYTWFNRLAAIRYLDARNWHPFHARVLMAASAEDTLPELFAMARTGTVPEELHRYVDVARMESILQGRIPSADPQGEAYRMLVLGACRFYHGLLPDVFERLDDETELLLPDDLLTQQSVAHGFRTEITDEDCDQVEVLGWLYQFYISEKKDQVMARKAAVPAEDIPAVTQLFTPHWIVRYLVENSVGRLWLLNRPESLLKAWMPYYIEPAEPETDFLRIAGPQDIRLCDPAVGSGHMLTYAFDLFYVIYEEEGYAPSEIPALILRHNLTGIEIDARAAQLAALALTLKGREKSPRFFQQQQFVRPNIVELRNIHFAEGELPGYGEALGLGGLFTPSILRLMHQFEEANNFGSLIQPCVGEADIAFARGSVEARDLGSNLFLNETHKKVMRVLEQAAALAPRYQVIVANPPYMGSGQMNRHLKKFVGGQYSSGKGDSYAAFILRNLRLVRPRGLIGMITIPNWMFLSGFASLRDELFQTARIAGLAHCGRGVWGADFGSCAFVIEGAANGDKPGVFRRLFRRAGEVQSSAQIEQNYLSLNEYPVYLASSKDFQAIPGLQLAYWLSPSFRATFSSGTPIGARAKKGLSCSGTELFYRFFWEVSREKLSFGGGDKWFPITKGGAFRKWFGNNEFVINWENNGHAIKMVRDSDGKTLSAVRNEGFYFKKGGSWNDVSIGAICCRFAPEGSIPTDSGPMLYSDDKLHYLIAFMNSKVAAKYAEVLCPTVHFGVGQVASFPMLEVPGFSPSQIEVAIDIARTDWDSSQTSPGFLRHPLLSCELASTKLSASWADWCSKTQAAILRMREIEAENNRLFIDAYSLHDELSPDVPEEQITLARADVRRDMASLLSYAVGCMMGRYSLDHPGLVLADAGHGLAEYAAKVGKSPGDLTFAPDRHGVVPVLDDEWFADDIAARTREFLKVAFGEATLRENIRFIEESLGRDLRSYFLTDFYKDHLQTYKKRPIYWMVQSPRKGFSVLIYLHRYTRDTMNVILNRYLREFQVKLRSKIDHLAAVQTSASTTVRDKTLARRESDKLTRTLHECQEWERQTILPLAQARIELDLDAGVKLNYLKLGEALAPIPGLAAAED